MSWQEYVDSTLVGSGKICDAAILGIDGSLWAISSSFQLQEPEIHALLAAYNDPKPLQEHGLQIAGDKDDDRSIYVRKGAMGACIVKTGQCVIVANFDAGKVAAGDATKTVEDLADYLLGAGY